MPLLCGSDSNWNSYFSIGGKNDSYYFSDFLKAYFLKGNLFLIALKPRGLLLSLSPEKGGKESAKGGVV